ncbi:MAG: DUF2207 domain-containing protein [Muribaculaceae bacterium]|nr:DUF2207 domain-containing protein [Muribaculaceae bacterium]
MKLLRPILVSLISTLATITAVASDVLSLDIDVRLTHNGRANITEHWKIDVSDNITEWYLVQSNLGPIEIKDFAVRDDDGPFIFEGDWDIDRSRSQKDHRCGIVDKGDNNYELCWGVGKSGLNDYYVSYTKTNFVKQFTDSCAFNHMFVARNLSYISRVRVEISADSAMTHENTRMWAFGHNHGIININDSTGTVVEEIEGFTKSSAVIIMLAFDPKMFDPEYKVDEPFEVMKQRALNGSDYRDSGSDDGPDWLESHLIKWFGESAGETIYEFLLGLFMIFMGLLFLTFMFPSCFGVLLYYIFLIPLIWLLKWLWWLVSLKPLRVYLKKRKMVGEPTWCRDLPADGSLEESSKILNSFNYGMGKKGYDNLISAYIMRLISQGAITIITKTNPQTDEVEQHFTFLPWDRKIKPESNAPSRVRDDNIIKGLYDILMEAAGDDMTLQPNELKKWAKKHTKKVKKWYEKIDIPYNIDRANPKFVKDVYGLKKYLKDFTIINERHIVDVALWDEYLVYATLYGIADQVARDFQKVCPEYYQLSKTAKTVMFDAPTHTFVDSMSTAMIWSTTSAVRSASVSNFSSSMGSAGSSWGGGGGSSWGGGGGFSGGGSGGGGR